MHQRGERTQNSAMHAKSSLGKTDSYETMEFYAGMREIRSGRCGFVDVLRMRC